MAALVPVTGEGEDYVLWRLPYARGLRYLHAAAVANGQKMELERGGADEEARESMVSRFEALRGRWRERAD